MSLRAKLEAVIYAADEPVTLTQLAALFTADALEWKAEQDAAAAAAAAAREPAPSGFDPGAGQQADRLAELGLDPVLELRVSLPQTSPQTSPETSPDTGPQPAAEAPEPVSDQESAPGEGSATTPVAATNPPEAEPAAAAEPPVDPETEARRLARQRDREVKAVLRQVLDGLIADYTSDERGVEIREIAGGYRMATKPECHDAVRLFIKSQKPPMKLSLPALETLAVIAYKQPVTAPEVNEIRGVESAGVLGSLLSRKLITTAGRKQVIGRPILYKTTREFLLRFGLKDVSELPSMEEFEKIAAIELNEENAAEQAGSEPHADAAETPDAARQAGEDAPLPLEVASEPEGQSAATAALSEPAASASAASAQAASGPAQPVPATEVEAAPTPTAEAAAAPEIGRPAEASTEAPPAEPDALSEPAETETSPHE